MKTVPTVAIGFTTPSHVDEEHNLALMSAIGLANLDHNVLYWHSPKPLDIFHSAV
jgi:hypothetical protein